MSRAQHSRTCSYRDLEVRWGKLERSGKHPFLQVLFCIEVATNLSGLLKKQLRG